MARVIVGEVEEKATVRVTPVDTIKGDPGEDGVSPIFEVEAITGGYRLTITDANGTHTFDLMDGTDGKDGQDGKDGKDGQDGEPGDDGVSPTITITTITGGHRVTITDADHPGGQTFDVMDGEGGSGGTTDYDDLINKPQIGGVTLSGNKTPAQLGLAAASDIPTVPVQSVNGQTGAVTLTIPSTAADVGALPDDTTAEDIGGITYAAQIVRW